MTTSSAVASTRLRRRAAMRCNSRTEADDDASVSTIATFASSQRPAGGAPAADDELRQNRAVCHAQLKYPYTRRNVAASLPAAAIAGSSRLRFNNTAAARAADRTELSRP